MAYEGKLCTDAEITLYAGDNLHATADTEAHRNLLVAQAESFLMLIGNYDFVTNVASLKALGKQTLAEYCARFVAVGLIAFDAVAITTATSLIEFEDRIQIHLFRMKQIENLITESDYAKRISGA